MGAERRKKGEAGAQPWLYRKEKGGGAAAGRAQATDGHGGWRLDGFQERGALESEKQ
jgi:hypothetical protein